MLFRSYKWLDFAAVLGFASMSIYSMVFFLMSIVHREEFNKRFVISQAQAIHDAGNEKENLE